MSNPNERKLVYTTVVATKVEPETNDALGRLARTNHRSKSAEARLALIRHIERENNAA
jgi:predicted transcriptional regulator